MGLRHSERSEESRPSILLVRQFATQNDSESVAWGLVPARDRVHAVWYGRIPAPNQERDALCALMTG